MKIFYHADDLGISKGVTRNIIKGIDSGLLNSSSLVANGNAFEYAIGEVKQRPALNLSIHLNFIEGTPLSPPEEIPLLVDKNGELNNSFVSLWLRELFSSSRTRQEIRKQLQTEIEAQIHKVATHLGSNYLIRVDSHQHTHMLPHIFDILLNISDKYKISYIRTTAEPFFLSLKAPKSLSTYIGVGLLKHYLLNFLTRLAKRKLETAGIQTCTYFIGVLFTGRMSAPVVECAKSSLARLVKNDDEVEILFHPGKALPGEEHIWRHRPDLINFYYSPWRDFEGQTVLNNELK